MENSFEVITVINNKTFQIEADNFLIDAPEKSQASTTCYVFVKDRTRVASFPVNQVVAVLRKGFWK